MALLDLVTLPYRVASSATQVTFALAALVAVDGPVRRPGGYAERLMLLIGEDGAVDRLSTKLRDPDGPVRLVDVLAEMTAPDRPLGQALARDGALDRLLVDGGPVDQLTAPDGPLERLLAAGGALDRVTATDGVLDRVLAPGGLLERLLTDDGFVDKLIAPGGTLDQLIELGDTLERIHPALTELIALVPALHESVEGLNQTVGPLGELAGRLPGARRRPAALEG